MKLDRWPLMVTKVSKHWVKYRGLFITIHPLILGGKSVLIFPEQGLNPFPLPWKHGVLTTGLPGNSHYPYFAEGGTEAQRPCKLPERVTLPMNYCPGFVRS